MRKKRNSGSRTGVVLVVMLCAATGLGVLAAYVKSSAPLSHKAMDHAVVSNTVSKPTSVDDTDDSSVKEAHVYAVLPKGDGPDLAHVPVNLKAGDDKLVAVGTAVIQGFDKTGVRILQVDVKDHVAAIHLNRVLNGFGSMEESQFVKSLQETYAQFPNIDKLELWCDGQQLDTVGHFEISDGIAVKHAGSSSAKS